MNNRIGVCNINAIIEECIDWKPNLIGLTSLCVDVGNVAPGPEGVAHQQR